jgi:hypothetical protein
MTNENEDWLDEELNSPEFNHGIKIGLSIGESNKVTEAQRAFDMGEIELWLAHNKAKTIEDWDAWYAEHPREEMKDRWSRKKD